MISKIIVAALVLLLLPAFASAQTCNAVPNTLTNGTTADATQVMANFNAIVACIGGLRGYLGGLTMSNDATNPNTVIDTSAGVANSDDVTTMMTLGAFAKNANAAWAVGGSNGCLDTGSGLAANTWYHLFVIARTDTSVVDELCSTSATSPVLPTSYTKKRRIGSFYANSSGQILPFIQNGDEFLLKSEILSFSTGSLGPTVTPYAVSTPPGVSTVALLKASAVNASSLGVALASGLISTTLSTDALSLSGAPNIYASGNFDIRTDTSQHIIARANVSSTTLTVVTQGWMDTRGRFN